MCGASLVLCFGGAERKRSYLTEPHRKERGALSTLAHERAKAETADGGSGSPEP